MKLGSLVADRENVWVRLKGVLCVKEEWDGCMPVPPASECGGNEGALGSVDGDGMFAVMPCVDPTTQRQMTVVRCATRAQYEAVVDRQLAAWKQRWRDETMPARGQVLRVFGERLRELKSELGTLIALETGKVLAEGEGEIQEVIDICEYAVGLSRSIAGQVLPSERRDHTLLEMWHPRGVVGVITAFNFPAAVWGWNAALALVTGNAVLWKPAPTGNLIAVALTQIMHSTLEELKYPKELCSLVAGRTPVGQWIADDLRMGLVSFTGSCDAGRKVAVAVAGRLGASLLELGGNNALVVHADADLPLALDACFFGACGTAGQRCTTTRRVLVNEAIYDSFVHALVAKYEQHVQIGDPLDPKTLVGPLHAAASVERYRAAISRAVQDGGTVLVGGSVRADLGLQFVEPTVIGGLAHYHALLMNETFAPILYVIKYATLDEAIAINNQVPQGLSSALFSLNMRNSWKWLSAQGADSGLVNVNVGTSGAEIGGAFGGEKDSGGGRESGSDAWKAYCRRVTATVNYGMELPLSQGISFTNSSS